MNDPKGTALEATDGFLKTVYSDWRDKTGSGYFTIFFIGQLLLWNWKVILFAVDDELGATDKIAEIAKVSNFITSFFCPLIMALLLCFAFAGLHWGLAHLLQWVEVEREHFKSEGDASIHYSRKLSYSRKEEEYHNQLKSEALAREKSAEATARAKEVEIKNEEVQRKQSRETILNSLTQQGLKILSFAFREDGRLEIDNRFLSDSVEKVGSNSPYGVIRSKKSNNTIDLLTYKDFALYREALTSLGSKGVFKVDHNDSHKTTYALTPYGFSLESYLEDL